MDNATRRQLLEQAKQVGYTGSILDVFQNPQVLDEFVQQQQQMQIQQQQLQLQQVDKEKDRQLQIELALINAENDDKKNSASLEKMMKDFEIKQKQLELKEQEINNKLIENNTGE